jgi:hypothetical protein
VIAIVTAIAIAFFMGFLFTLRLMEALELLVLSL